MGTSGMRMGKLLNFLCNAATCFFSGWNGIKQLPEILICLFIEHMAAAAYITLFRCSRSVISSPQDMGSLIYGNVGAGEITVPDQISGSAMDARPPPIRYALRLP